MFIFHRRAEVFHAVKGMIIDLTNLLHLWLMCNFIIWLMVGHKSKDVSGFFTTDRQKAEDETRWKVARNDITKSATYFCLPFRLSLNPIESSLHICKNDSFLKILLILEDPNIQADLFDSLFVASANLWTSSTGKYGSIVQYVVCEEPLILWP